MKKLPLPPKSTRYCLNCERYRQFMYNRMIGHSRCEYCTSNYSKRFSPEDRKKRYCERNNLPYEKPPKPIKVKKEKVKNKVVIKKKEKIYSEGYLKQIEQKRLKSKRINEANS